MSNPAYEAEPTQNVALGSVQVNATTWWSGSIATPEDQTLALLELRRHGDGLVADDAISFNVALTELPAVATLLAMLLANKGTAQAR
jgi:hypothetical protein